MTDDEIAKLNEKAKQLEYENNDLRKRFVKLADEFYEQRRLYFHSDFIGDVINCGDDPYLFLKKKKFLKILKKTDLFVHKKIQNIHQAKI